MAENTKNKILINNCKNGDMLSFRQLLDQYQPYVYSIAFRFLNNISDAEDIVQDCFIRIWKNIHRYNEQYKFSTWVYKIVTNLCFDLLRQKNRNKIIDYYESPDSLTTGLMDHTNIESDIINDELKELVNKLVNELSPKQRMVFILRDIENVDVKEIEQIMSLSPGKIKSNLYYARRNMREKLEIIYKS